MRGFCVQMAVCTSIYSFLERSFTEDLVANSGVSQSVEVLRYTQKLKCNFTPL